MKSICTEPKTALIRNNNKKNILNDLKASNSKFNQEQGISFNRSHKEKKMNEVGQKIITHLLYVLKDEFVRKTYFVFFRLY